MALNSDNLAQEIVDTIDQTGLSDDEKTFLLNQWKGVAGAIINHFKNNAELSEAKLEQSLNSVFSTGTPVPQDGGTALKTAWTSATAGGAKDNVVGGIK